MPRLWTDTIDEHRRSVQAAILSATAKLVAENGLSAVTMSEVAERAGIGRATLYKYFPDVASILMAWHEQQIGDHLRHLAAVRDHTDGAGAQLAAVVSAYAHISHHGHGDDLSVRLHQGEHVAAAYRHLRQFLTELIAAAAADGKARSDVPAAELAQFCLHALGAAGQARSKAAVDRVAALALDAVGARPGLRPHGAATHR